GGTGSIASRLDRLVSPSHELRRSRLRVWDQRPNCDGDRTHEKGVETSLRGLGHEGILARNVLPGVEQAPRGQRGEQSNDKEREPEEYAAIASSEEHKSK